MSLIIYDDFKKKIDVKLLILKIFTAKVERLLVDLRFIKHSKKVGSREMESVGQF